MDLYVLRSPVSVDCDAPKQPRLRRVRDGDEMSTPYRPSNATEGDFFEHRNCTDCIYYPSGRCMKIATAMMGGQPRSWVRDENGNGICTAKKTSLERQIKKQPKEQIGMEL